MPAGTPAVQESGQLVRRGGEPVASPWPARFSTLALYGLPPERLDTYVVDVSAVIPAQARVAAARYFDADRADLVVVGDAQHFYAGLRRVRPNAERIPVTELNLDSETLRG